MLPEGHLRNLSHILRLQAIYTFYFLSSIGAIQMCEPIHRLELRYELVTQGLGVGCACCCGTPFSDPHNACFSSVQMLPLFSILKMSVVYRQSHYSLCL